MGGCTTSVVTTSGDFFREKRPTTLSGTAPIRYVCTSHSSSASHFWSALVLASETQFSGLEHLELSCQLESLLHRSQDTKR